MTKPAGIWFDKKIGKELVFGNFIQMDSAQNLERLARSISSLNRDNIEKKIRNFKGRFKLDFTEDYLRGLTVDRLRHILFAAMVTNRKKAN
ncbi:MAG: hypothetical protein PHP01_06335 [Phycisphaerae bacterium]|nr:hypothetical protein [Phycisphaerae bacterium]